MKHLFMAVAGLALVGMTSVALANPATLPKHPGYPSRGEFANDAGQPNLTYAQSMLDAAKSGDTNMEPARLDPSNARVLKHQGAGRLPLVQGPNITIDPPVKEGTRMPAK